MNMTNELQIKTVILSQVLDRSIITMHIKHCNKLSNRIMPNVDHHVQYVKHDLREENIRSFVFLDNSRIERTLHTLNECALWTTTTNAHPTMM
jgi:hypothetical protein